MKHYLKIYTSQVSVDFYNKLIQHPFFNIEDNWKLIAPCWRICNVIYNNKISFRKNPNDLPYEHVIEPVFKAFKCSISTILHILEDIGIFENVNWSYCNDPNFGYCRQYFISEEVEHWIAYNNCEYLTKLHHDKLFRRQENKKRCKRFVKLKFTDNVCAYNAENIKCLMISAKDVEDADREISCGQHLQKFSEKQKKNSDRIIQNQLRHLRLSQIRIFNDIYCDYNEDDGRIHSSFVGCIKALRNKLCLKDGKKLLINAGDVDYRAMHPTFFAHYVLNSLAKEQEKSGLMEEYKQWNDFWGNTEIHPRNELMNIFGYDVTDENAKFKFKKQLLSVLNDKNSFYELEARNWIAENFPKMFKIWFIDNNKIVNETGCNLSKIYEKQLLRNPKFYDFIATINCKIIDCHDGVSVFCEKLEDFADISEKIIRFQTTLCQNLFNITPVITNK